MTENNGSYNGSRCSRRLGAPATVRVSKRARLELVLRNQVKYCGPSLEGPAREKGWRLRKPKPQQEFDGIATPVRNGTWYKG